MSQMKGAGQAAAQGHSTGELVKQVAEQVSVLVRDELKLAQLEMTRKGKQAGTGIGMLGGGGLIALYGAGKGRLEKAAPPVPREAVNSVKTDVEEIKERVRR